MSANNAILIEAGMSTGFNPAEMGKRLQEMVGKVDGLKREGLITEHRVYLPVTGNRTERAISIVLECTHEQLEKVVNAQPYIDLMTSMMADMPNFTTNRMVFGDILKRIEEA